MPRRRRDFATNSEWTILQALSVGGPANKSELYKRTKRSVKNKKMNGVGSFSTVFDCAKALLRLRLIQVLESKQRCTGYGTKIETYALTGRGLTAFLTKVENWSKLSQVQTKNQQLFGLRNDDVFTDSEFKTLDKLRIALVHAGIFKDVLRRMYDRLCGDLLPKLDGLLGSPPIENYESKTPPSTAVVEAFAELATAAADPAKTAFLGLKYDAGKLRPFHEVLDEMGGDDRFAVEAYWTFGMLLGVKHAEVKVIDSMLKRFLPRTIYGEYCPLPREFWQS